MSFHTSDRMCPRGHCGDERNCDEFHAANSNLPVFEHDSYNTVFIERNPGILDAN